MTLQRYRVPTRKLKGSFQAQPPGSKSITNRALIAAALCRSEVVLEGALESDDTLRATEALRQCGVDIQKDKSKWVIQGSQFPKVQGQPRLFLGNAGTAMRFLTATLSACEVSCILDGTERMRQRPIQLLLDALIDLGAKVRSESANGCPPVFIEKGGLEGGETEISGKVSSQFFSGLMFAAPLARNSVTLKVSDEWASKPYIEMTASLLESFGIQTEIHEKDIYIPSGQHYKRNQPYRIEPDATAASYPLGLAALQGCEVRLNHLNRSSIQGDVEVASTLSEMGVEIEWGGDFIGLKSQGAHALKPIQANLEHIPDAAMTVVVLCAVAKGKSKLTGLSNLKYKECDRLKALETELNKMGSRVVANDDGFEIEGVDLESLKPAEIETYDDHRMAMCLSLLGTLVDGTVILDPNCVNKTYPTYWEELESWMIQAQ